MTEHTADYDAPWTPCPIHASQQQPCRECRLGTVACLACREEGFDLACIPTHADCPIPPAEERRRMTEHTAENDAPRGLTAAEWTAVSADIADEIRALGERAQQAEATVRRIEALAAAYEIDAASEDYGGELWSVTAEAIRAALDGRVIPPAKGDR